MKNRITQLVVVMVLLCCAFNSNAQHPEPVLLKDVYAGSTSGYKGELYASNGKLFFAGVDTGNIEPWISDGTDTGTRILRNVNRVTSPFVVDNSSSPQGFTTLGSKVLFSATYNLAGVENRELFISDGTTAGTVLLKNINTVTFSSSSNPRNFTVLGNKAVFVADDGVHGDELWITDGTTAGTYLLKDISPGVTTSRPAGLTVSGSVIYFCADDGVNGLGLWITDGTAPGTVKIKDLDPATIPSYRPYVEFAAFAGKMFFSIPHSVHGMELWVTDGTAVGTQLFVDINPGADGADPYLLTPIGDKMYFSARDGVHGAEPWVTDGTAAGTMLLSDVNPGAGSGIPYDFTAYNNKVFFSASNDDHNRELWVTDSAGTRQYIDIVPGAAGSSVINLRTYNNRLYFATYTRVGAQWMCIEGDDTTVQLVMPASATFDMSIDGEGVNVVEMNGSLYFDAIYSRSVGVELYKITTTPYEPPVSVGTAVKDLVLKIYPNPAVNEFTIEGEALRSVSVYDQLGRLVYRSAIDNSVNKIQVPCAHWPVGIYNAVVTNVAGTSSTKLLQK